MEGRFATRLPRVIIGADGGAFMVAYVPELDVQTMVFDEEDDEEAPKNTEKKHYGSSVPRCSCTSREEAELVSGEACPGRGVVLKLLIEADGTKWRLGRTSWGRR